MAIDKPIMLFYFYMRKPNLLIKTLPMTTRNESKLNMYDAVISFCNNNASVTASIPAFQSALTNFQSTVAGIHSNAQLEANIITGHTASKADLKQTLATAAANLAALVYAYAIDAKDSVLRERVNIVPSEFKKFKDEMLIAACSNIRDAANANIAELAPYGITASSITDLQTAIDAYAAKISSPRNAVSQRASYSKAITALFKQADGILKKQLDKMALNFQAANIDFYNTYKSNRTIIDPGTSATSIAGTVTNSDNGQPVAGAHVQLVGNGHADVTDAQGNYILKSIEIGTQQVKITCAGFADDTISNIIVKLGKTTTVSAAISPVAA